MHSFDFRKPAVFHEAPSVFQMELGAVCSDRGGELIGADAFYREIFPPDTIEHYHKGYPEKNGHKGNPIILCQRGAVMYPDFKPDWAYGVEVENPEGEYHIKHTKRILFNDYQWLHDWKNLPDCNHVWTSGLTYIGKNRDLNHAVAMHALIFDIDFMTKEQLNRFFASIDYGEVYIRPNYIVLSGTGIHLYYVFEEPLPLYHGTYGRKVKGQLNELKIALTRLLWNPYTVGEEHGRKPQYQGINQAFRLVGSYTKSLDAEHNRYKVIAYKFPNVKKYDSLQPFYDKVNIPEERHYRERSTFGLDYWKEKNPDWYERRIVQKDKSVKYWNMDRALYDWWLRQIREGATFGHRYNCLYCAVVYGVKCNIPVDEVEKDLIELLPHLTGLRPEDPITRNDVYEALDAYTEALNTYPVKSIKYLSGIEFESPRRNGRKQAVHVKLMRAQKEVLKATGEMKPEGRPQKQDIVKAWREAHPDGKKAQCIRDTGLSKPTVLKWW